MTIGMQPSTERTLAKFVHNAVEPPSLVIHDGTTTLVFSPADLVGGLADAAEFAAVLVQVARKWESSCRRTLAATQPEHAPSTAPKPAKRTALVAARKAAGFSQEELAARVGVERSTVYRWESGETTPLPMLRPGLARLLRLDSDQLSALLGEPVNETGGHSAHGKGDQG